MKRTILLSLLTLMNSIAIGQTYELDLTDKPNAKLYFDIDRSDLQIEGYDGNSLIITTTNSIDRSELDRQSDLTPMFQKKPDNTAIGLNVEIKNDLVRIEKVSRSRPKYFIKIPKQHSINIGANGSNFLNGEIHIRSLEGAIEVDAKGSNILISDVPGPVVASNVYGKIIVEFSNAISQKPSSFVALGGLVDITMPSGVKADLKISTNQELYTSFDIKEDLDTDVHSGAGRSSCFMGGSNCTDQHLVGSINGGGMELSIRTINGNVYLRKQ